MRMFVPAESEDTERSRRNVVEGFMIPAYDGRRVLAR